MIEKSSQEDLKKRSASRLFAVQALHQIAQCPEDPENVAQQFFDSPLGAHLRGQKIEGDPTYVRKLIVGTSENQEIIDTKIQPFLIKSWDIRRLDPVVLAILRVAFFEMMSFPEIPKPLIINEYVTLAYSFFTDGPEKAFVNAVLDKFGKSLEAS
jgi:N utilization substance protein B